MRVLTINWAPTAIQAFTLMEKSTGGLRKGTWTQEEDNLLRDCVHKYGEGKWHLVPQRAGLKRCRKSCRMRWLNYLKPNINRESFSEDEVDMIMRFHKLLGNRWSLIAGRLPGRTANDVKNFWHTNIRNRKRKEESQVTMNIEAKEETENNIVEKKREVQQHVVIKPQPHTFSKNSPWLRSKSSDNIDNIDKIDVDICASSSGNNIKEGIVAEPCAESEEWWESLLSKEVGEGQVGNVTLEFWDHDIPKLEGQLFGEGHSCWGHCSCI